MSEPAGVPDSAARTLNSVGFDEVFAGLPAPFVVLDPALRILAANRAFEVETGRSEAELVGLGLFEAFPATADALDGDGRIRTQVMLEQVLATKRPASTPPYRHDVTGSDGELVEAHWMLTTAPVLGPDGEVALLVQRAENVADFVLERQRSEQASASSRSMVWTQVSSMRRRRMRRAGSGSART